jgi:hypothetical protein
MTRVRMIFALALLLPLAGCYSGQQKDLAACDARAAAAFPKPVPGQPLKAIQACMDQAGYRFIGWNDGVICDMTALIRGQPDRGAVICFEPKNWLALKLYRLEVPERSQAAPPQG